MNSDRESDVYDVLIVGAGISGLYALYKLRSLGFRVRAVEMGSGVGGTWYWNKYPGARCDTESVQYSYSFDAALQEEWDWTERFAGQPEILSYLNHVADRFNLRPDIDLNTKVERARFDEENTIWSVSTDTGKTYRARFCVMASGCLTAAPNTPEIPGLSHFKGQVYYTARWPDEAIDFGGKRVAVIGTASSGIQVITELAQHADHVQVFQRTPNYSLPGRNGPMPPEHARNWKENHADLRRQQREVRGGTLLNFPTQAASEVDADTRERIYADRWAMGGPHFMVSFNDLIINETSNETAADFVRRMIKQIVKDPVVAEKLTPYDHPIFAKRICIDTGYFETYNRGNVGLTDLKSDPIVRVTANGVETEGETFPADIIILATGFDAITGPLLRIDVRGKDGQTLKDKWKDGPQAYLGLMCAGFPNFFTITGPGSPSVLGNMYVNIEQHVEWIADCLDHMRKRGIRTIEADGDSEAQWMRHVAEVANGTVYPKATSWYMGANILGKPRVFLPYIGGSNTYREITAGVASDGYRGFVVQ